jgi:hypothetical protein
MCIHIQADSYAHTYIEAISTLKRKDSDVEDKENAPIVQNKEIVDAPAPAPVP